MDRGFFDTWAGKQSTRELFSVLALYWIVIAANGPTAMQSLQGTERTDGQSLTDGEVVADVLAGEVGLFEILMRRYNRRLYRIARAILRDEAEAEDTVQQAYLNAYANLDRFAGRASFATWLTRIAVNEALRRIAQHWRFEVLDENSETGRDGIGKLKTVGDMEHQMTLRELSGALERAIDELPNQLRGVFVLCDVEQLSTAEAAQVLETKEVTVRTRLHRARRSLRRTLLTHFGEAATHVFDFVIARCDHLVAVVLSRLGHAG